MRKYIPLIFVIFSFLISMLAWKYYPVRFATHWGISGQADGFSEKGIVVILFQPFLMLFLSLILVYIPKLDPKKASIDKFKHEYEVFIYSILGFILYLQLAIFVWNVCFEYNIAYAMVPGLATLFYAIGGLLEKAKQNYTIGIRTPWTLASEEVWEKTHKLGARIIRIGALASLVGLILPKLFVYIFLTCIIASMLFLVIYSYVEYTKLKK